MSAYVLHPSHIAALAAYAVTEEYPNVVRILTDEDRGTMVKIIAACLMNENIRSVASRYPDDKSGERPGYSFTDEEFVQYAQRYAVQYLHKMPKLDAIDILAMANSYDYQACETDDYDSTPAAQQVALIRSTAIRNLPGYDEAIRDFADPRELKGE